MRPSRWVPFAAVLIAVGALGGCSGEPGPNPPGPPPPPPPPPAPQVGSIEVVASTINLHLAPGAQYTYAVDGGAGQSIGPDATAQIGGLTAGTHNLELRGVPAGCRVRASLTVTVPANGTVQAPFVVICSDGTPPGDKIAFTSDRDGNWEIYTMNVDGSGVVRLTNDPADDWYPTWSPDGARIAFATRRGGNLDIWLMNADGAALVRVTRAQGNEDNPAWSPDGNRIAFDASRVSIAAARDVMVIGTDGTGEINLTQGTQGSCAELPTWSPDGTKLLFASDASSCSAVNFELFTIGADGTGRVKVATRADADFIGDWSPDGRKIVFDGHVAGNFQVFLMNVDGTGLIQLTSASASSGGPRWSSDGTKIVFGSERDGNGEIYVADADGSNVVRLTNHAASDTWAAWKRR